MGENGITDHVGACFEGGAVLATQRGRGPDGRHVALLEQFPFSAVSGLLAVTLIVTFFVTSSDSSSVSST